LVPVAGATFLDFEGLADRAKIPDGYGGFDWSGWFWALDAARDPRPSGYKDGLVSGKNVALNGFFADVSFWIPSGTFTLNSLYLTGAFNDGLHVDITGCPGGSQVHSTTVVLNSTARTRAVLDWSGIDEVAFHSYGGQAHGYPDGSGEHFVIDDLEVNSVPAVPRPLAALPFLLGLAVRRRRR